MKPQLAGKFVEEKVAKMLPLIGQVKYDGIRSFVRSGILWSRSIKAIRSEQIQSWCAHNRDFLEGLDGELICGPPTAPDCYTRTSSSVMSYNKPDEFCFYAFDKWDEPTPFKDRIEVVAELTSHFVMESGPTRIVMAPNVMLNTMEEVWAFYEEQVLLGHEGIILRDPDSYYKYGRGSPVKCECIKMKEGGWVDTEVKIVEFHEQLHNANEATLDNLGNTERSGHKENLIGKGTLGSISVKGNFVDGGAPFECRVGTGLDDAIRQAVWDNPDEYKDLFVKMKYFTVGIKDKPRFPTFLGFRHPDDMDLKQGELF